MADDTYEPLPSVIPARMMSEYVYCPRFFHLAWSARENGENDFTVEGKWAHRAIDRREQVLPEPAVELQNRRSVTLESHQLGLMAKIDMIETAGRLAVPLEYKRGSPRDGPDPIWDPERVQLTVAGLLLRAHGYNCEHGRVYFTGSRQHVTIEFTEALTTRVQQLVDEARQVALDPIPPPPLVDSPKCPACVLVGICLPDEQNLFRTQTTAPPRRLLPADPAARPLYVTTAGARAGKRGERIEVSLDGDLLESARFIDVSQLVVYGNVGISTPLVRELLSRDIPVCWYSSGGWFAGIAEGLPSKNVELRRRQALAASEVQVAVAARMVEAKILNSRTLLRRNGTPRSDGALRDLKWYATRARSCRDVEHLLGIEGAGAKMYFSHFATMLKSGDRDAFCFEHRNHRPPRDRVNCLLSYTYGLLVRDLTTTALSVGLDPYMGVFHRPRFGRPALALDVMEEFRPLVADSTVIGLINNGELARRSFVEAGGAVSLTQDGRRTVLRAYERRLDTEFTHPAFSYRITYRRAFEVQTRMLAAVLLGEFDDYRPIVTR